MKKRLLLLLIAAFAVCWQAFAVLNTTSFGSNDYIEEWGQLKLVTTPNSGSNKVQLADKNGKAVQLTGWATHGLQWPSVRPYFDAKNDFEGMKNLGATVVRLTCYITEGANWNDTEQWVKQAIDWCAELGLYAIVDFHVLTPGDPSSSQYNPSGQTFFTNISGYVKQKGYIHVLYEICNEPNGVSWSQVKSYAEKILPIIAANDPNAVVIVGTPQWAQLLGDANNNKITHSSLQIMYTFHFYAGQHGEFLGSQFTDNMLRSIPVVVTEWSNTGASGRGNGNDSNARTFLERCNNTATQRVSWTAWSWSPIEWEKDGMRTSSAWKDGTPSNGSGYTVGNFSPTGKLAYDNLSTFNWERCSNEVTVTFDAGEGATAVNPQSVCPGQKAVKPVDPRKTGFRFDKWMQGSTEYNFNSTVTGNITLTATWMEGEGDTDLFDGEKETSETNICTWWFTADDGTAGIIDPTPRDEDGNIIPSADGTRNSMNVSYKTVVNAAPLWDKWGCQIGFSLSPESDEETIIPVNITGATSFTFDYKASHQVAMAIALSNGKQYVQQVPKKLQPTNGAWESITVDLADFECFHWDLPETDPARGIATPWDDDCAKLAGQVLFVFEAAAVSNGKFGVDNLKMIGKVLESCAEPCTEVVVTFNNGTESSDIKTCEGNDVFAPRDPSKVGFDFEGWSETEGGETAFEFPYVATAAKTFYAIWTERTCTEYTATFMNGATKHDEVINCEGETIAQPAAPTKAGYEFDGWYIGENKATFPHTLSENVTFTAKFSELPGEPLSITLPWNQYDAVGTAYQATETTKLPVGYEPQVNDVITVRVVGTANEDMEDFLIAVIDDRAAVEYWGQYSNMPSFGAVTAGEEFDFSVDVTISTITQAGADKPTSFGTALSNPKFVLVGKNSVLSTTGTGGKGTGTKIDIDFTRFDVDIFTPIPGATVFTLNADGKNQALPQENKLPVTTVEAGNKFKINITGVSDVDATDFQVVLVDGTEAANHWTELSEYITFDGAITAGQPFNMSVDLDVLAAQIGEGASSLQLIFTAVSDAKIIQIVDFEVTIADITNVSEVVSSSVNVYAVAGGLVIEGAEKAVVYGIDGRIVATATGKIALEKGIYIVKADNEVIKVIVK